ncbi:MAG: glycosyltransferase family 9 protein [SAR324 cluster bacterium]|nr:glycosyltransferase family 9 protein [SAR324 cluster bacterium]
MLQPKVPSTAQDDSRPAPAEPGVLRAEPGVSPAGARWSLPEEARVLIIRFSSLGDVVKCTALPRLIKARYPRARITFVTASDFLELIRDNPHLERAVGFDRRGGLGALAAFGRELAAEPPDLIVDVHKSLRSRWLKRFLSGRRTAYSKHTLRRALLIWFRVNTFQGREGKEGDFLAGLLPYGVVDDGRGTEVFTHRVAEDGALRRRLARELTALERWRREGRPVLGIAPIARWELKTWPLDSFREVVRGFVRKTGGGVVLFGGADDGPVEALLAGLKDKGVSLVGRTSLLESAYFASLTDLVVCNDTGMSHLAEAVGTDVVTLFGPTSRELGYFPVRPGSQPVEIPLTCRPCTRTGQGKCTHPHRKACLEGISPGDVLARVLARLSPDSAVAGS